MAQEHLLLLSQSSAEFSFGDVRAPTTPSVLRGFSAPVRLELELDTDELAWLAVADADAFVRWDAMQQLALRAIADPAATDALEAWLQLVSRLASDAVIEPAVAGRMLELPSERFILQVTNLEVDAVRSRRWAVAAAAERSSGEALRSAHGRLSSRAAEDAGARRLRNACLWYIHRAPSPSDVTACWRQFRGEQPFDNRWAAMRLLVDRGGETRRAVLQETYAAWCGRPERLDRWFAAQGASEAPDAADHARVLVTHPEFALADTARVKAFLDPFTQNLGTFHDRSGAGYATVFDLVVGLSDSNPRFAARVLRALDSWRRLDALRREMITARLNDLVTRPGLAREVVEVAERALRGGPTRETGDDQSL